MTFGAHAGDALMRLRLVSDCERPRRDAQCFMAKTASVTVRIPEQLKRRLGARDRASLAALD
jgi:hypothetical protein